MDRTNDIPKLDQPACYEIKVPGRLDESWSEWLEGMTVEVEGGEGVPTITTLTGEVPDQAAVCYLAHGQRALRLFANEEAADLFGRGLELLEPVPSSTEKLDLTARLQLALGRAQWKLGMAPESMNVCFQVKGKSSEKICDLLDKRGILKVGHGNFKAENYIRLICVNADMTFADIDYFFEQVKRVAEEV